jgi:pre-mRNA-processing factor 39
MSVQRTHKRKIAVDGDEETTDRVRVAENGHPGVHVNDAEIRKGVDPYARLYQQQGINPYGPNGQPAPLTYTPSGLR